MFSLFIRPWVGFCTPPRWLSIAQKNRAVRAFSHLCPQPLYAYAAKPRSARVPRETRPHSKNGATIGAARRICIPSNSFLENTMALEWTKDLDGALARAKSEPKPLLIDFSAAPA